MSSSAKPKGRKPDFDLNAMLKEDNTTQKGNVGAAWQEEDGSISIVLNKFVVIDQMDNISLKLFPRRERTDEDSFSSKPLIGVTPGKGRSTKITGKPF